MAAFSARVETRSKPMSVWPNRRIEDLLGIELPIIQAPMAGSAFAEMAVAVSEAGGLGSLGVRSAERRATPAAARCRYAAEHDARST